jgi:hypothetical protein
MAQVMPAENAILLNLSRLIGIATVLCKERTIEQRGRAEIRGAN